MTRIRIVDDSKLAKEGMNYKRAPKVIHVYNKKNIAAYYFIVQNVILRMMKK